MPGSVVVSCPCLHSISSVTNACHQEQHIEKERGGHEKENEQQKAGAILQRVKERKQKQKSLAVGSKQLCSCGASFMLRYHLCVGAAARRQVRWAQLHPCRLSEDVQLSCHLVAPGLDHLALEIGKVSTLDVDLKGGVWVVVM